MRQLAAGSVLALGLSGAAYCQSSLVFPTPVSTLVTTAAAQSTGVSPVTFNGDVIWFFQGYNSGVCFQHDGSYDTCPAGLPLVDGVPQATVWNGTLYLAYALHGSHQLVIATTSDVHLQTWGYSEPAGLFVGVSPAIAVLNNKLFIAYQENQQDHYLGMASTFDGVNWTSQLSSVYKIGHAPGMTYFNGQLVIAAFCQCDSHYLDVYTSTGSLSPTFATEDRSKTLANASNPSLAVYNNVLMLGYMQNGQRYFQTTTSYNAVTWTPAVRQTSLTNGWNGLGLAVVGSTIYGVYESQSAIPGQPSGSNQFAISTTSGVH
jgi:hypothetical protein